MLKALIQRSGKYFFTDGEPKAECDIGNRVNTSVNSGVSDIDEVAHNGHHGRIDHADGETKSGVRNNQMANGASRWNL